MDIPANNNAINQSREWQALEALAVRWRKQNPPAITSDQFTRYCVALDGLLADFSKHWLDNETLNALTALADRANLAQWRHALFTGEKINHTENRAALHTALRQSGNKPVVVDDENIMLQIAATRQQVYDFAARVRQGKWRGHTGKAITDVVNIGIGGSHLGPEMVISALADTHTASLRVHFLANVDPHTAQYLFHSLNPETTLFIVASKTFTTAETLANARTARQWLCESLGSETAVVKHFVAVSNNIDGAREFGIASDVVFPLPDWVGGRYSLWSAIGLPVVLAYGHEVFDQLLQGARTVDQHFLSAPWQKNIPVIMALLEVWYSNFFAAQTQAIIPYRDALKLFPAYLQQLCMESLGKQITRTGQKSPVTTGSIVWGNAGTNGQHAFFQLLHQGSHLIPVDFILPLDNQTDNVQQHRALIANCLAQSQALFAGRTSAADAPSAHQQFDGNRPSTTLVLDQLDAHGLGMLIALYEHKVFTQSVIWSINPFDQWGVELGKELAKQVEEELKSSSADKPSAGLVDYVRNKISHS